MGAFHTLQQIKARFQNQAFIARNQIQRCLDMSLEAHFHYPLSFNLVKMNIEVNIAVWEASTGTAYGGHDLIIGNQFAQVQFKAVKKGFRGATSSSIKAGNYLRPHQSAVSPRVSHGNI